MSPYIIPIITAVVAYYFGLDRARRSSLRETRLRAYSNLIEFISKFPISKYPTDKEFTNELIKLMAPARLVASERTEFLMRDYFDETQNICKIIRGSKTPSTEKINQLTLDLEEAMRVDLGVRYFARKLIFEK